MDIMFSETQIRRLKELGAEPEQWNSLFNSARDRDMAFQDLQKQLVRRERARLKAFREKRLRPRLNVMEHRLAELLAGEGFVQVNTPILLSKSLLERMGIDTSHPLSSQIFWVDRSQCLRPMLAPHLYYVVMDLLRLLDRPVGLFEIGPCFRKESQGASHSNEFTMLNLAEFGLPEEDRHRRIRELAALVMKTMQIDDYGIETETSEVYGETFDVVAGPERLEVASCAMGPHPLDEKWGVIDTWVGLGFGLERLLMATEKHTRMGRFGRSLTYLDGIRLNI